MTSLSKEDLTSKKCKLQNKHQQQKKKSNHQQLVQMEKLEQIKKKKRLKSKTQNLMNKCTATFKNNQDKSTETTKTTSWKMHLEDLEMVYSSEQRSEPTYSRTQLEKWRHQVKNYIISKDHISLLKTEFFTGTKTSVPEKHKALLSSKTQKQLKSIPKTNCKLN